MSNADQGQVVPINQSKAGEIMEAVIARGDLNALTPVERAKYYTRVCESIGLNPLTKPFEYIILNGKLTLYARRDAADQLRKINGISIEVVSRTIEDGLLTVHVRAKDQTGRMDEDFGVVAMGGLKGEGAANAMLKCITKAKRRVTLSLSGLGWLDETEIADIPASAKITAPADIAEDAINRWGDAQGARLINATNSHAKTAAVSPSPTAAANPRPDEGHPPRVPAGEPIEPAAADDSSRPPAVAEAPLVHNDDDASASDPEPHKPPQAGPPAAQPARAPDPSDPGEMPGFLKRDRKAADAAREAAAAQLAEDRKAVLVIIPEADTYPGRIQGLLAAIQAKCAACTDFTDLAEAQQWCTQQTAKLAPAYQFAASAILETHRKRLSPETFDVAGWKRDLAGALSGVTEIEELKHVKNTVLLPAKEQVSEDDWDWAAGEYHKTRNALSDSILSAG